MERHVTRCRAVLLGLVMLALLLPGCDSEAEGPERTIEGAAAEQPENEERIASCEDLPSAEELRQYMAEAPAMAPAGGLFEGRHEWGAVVNRSGEVCAVASSTDPVSRAWPGSQAIALAKAYTANAFSKDSKPLSTARLYTLSQPGYSLWGAANGNPFDPDCLVAPEDAGEQEGEICGGTITFGGGLPLYMEGEIVGGLGLSGDTPCADHEIAKRVRDLAGLVPPGGNMVDDIIYIPADSASLYAHPLCPNTWRNGQRIGDEPPAQQYPFFAR